MDRVAWQAIEHGGRKESDMTERLSTAQHNLTNIPKNLLKYTSVTSSFLLSRVLLL